ncbi:hypothetical protein FRC00_008155 [Tulasnella sp. 408]|nr:hypothetical protein FRC00_008155 [Tulasnella sp. 408]
MDITRMVTNSGPTQRHAERIGTPLILAERLRLVERSELGSGNYGEVALGTLGEPSPTPTDVAVKRVKEVGTRGERVRLAKVGTTENSHVRERLTTAPPASCKELNIWAKIKHPNVVELIGYHLDEKYESPPLISGLMVNGNVLNYIERFKPDTSQSAVKDALPNTVLFQLRPKQPGSCTLQTSALQLLISEYEVEFNPSHSG